MCVILVLYSDPSVRRNRLSEEKKALLYIPDISGFTRFVNDTEIQHSQHIIEELLEVILQSNELNLEVSEIEGDAVLFYREGEPPQPVQISEQIKSMFFNFLFVYSKNNPIYAIRRQRPGLCHANYVIGRFLLNK